MFAYLLSKNKYINLLFIAVCTCAVSSYLGGAMYYAALMGVSSFFVLQSGHSMIFKGCAAILAIAIVSSIVNYPTTPAVFRPVSRMFILILVMCACAPIFNNSQIYKYRHKLFGGLAIGLTIVGVVSAYLATKGWGYWGKSEWIVGLSDFPNSLGYSLAVSVMFLSSLMPGRKWYLKVIFLIGLCVWAIPLTGTRTALYSLPIFFVVYIFLTSKTLGKMIKAFILLSIVSIIFFSNITLDMTIINRKNKASNFKENSRTSLFEGRFREFSEHPILGIGTFVVDMRWSPITENGNVEAGNTFLMFLSMNGSIGFLNFAITYFSLLFPFCSYILKRRKSGEITNLEIFLSAIVLYNFISMQQMGILLNPGMYITAFNWLTLSLMFKPKKFLYNTDSQIFI